MLNEVKSTAALTPQRLRELAREKAMAEAHHDFEQTQKIREEQKQVAEAFMAREVLPDAMDRLMPAVQRAAESGQSELLIMQFPANYLADGGRAINNFEPDWPNSLQGFAKRAHEYFEEHLRPLGYKVSARILEYPGGNLGDVGFFLSW
jgi:hypothetical protein